MTPQYDPQQELTAVEPVLQAIVAEHARALTDLLSGTDRGLAYLELAEKLSVYLQDLPPPEPTPPLTDYEILVVEDTLIPAPRGVWGYPKEADVNHNLVASAEVTKLVKLPDAMMPGSPAREFEVEVLIKRAYQRQVPGNFEYYLTEGHERVRIEVPAVPPDAPLTEVQEAYVREREFLAAQVRDMRMFIQAYGSQVDSIKSDTQKLADKAAELVEKVDALPLPKDIGPDLDARRLKIEALRQQLPARQQELQLVEDELAQLKTAIETTCPEIRL